MFIFWCDVREMYCVVDIDRFKVKWFPTIAALEFEDHHGQFCKVQQNPNQLFLL